MAGERRRARLRALLKTAGVPTLDPAAIESAFVHASAGKEQSLTSNERLEFFGDAILGFAASRWLMTKYPDASEGLLTRRKANLVSGTSCAVTARRLGFPDLVVLGMGMDRAGAQGNESILADAFEAFLAALYAASDLDRVLAFLEKEHFAAVDKRDAGDRDPKTDLQEFAQAVLRVTPLYFERAEGPPNDRRYTSQVRIGDEILGEGIGGSKKAAQQSAAAMALSTLRARHPAGSAAASASNDDGRVISINRSRRPRRPRTPEPGAPT
ncbi:ribonuclease 3 [Vulcanimicrobium alpinum]|uniref:Ribonuclease 3 n=1 Tax=Vulcanimicrobium alpinum TaxID=3016050 RepID=A0AAN1XZG7_UNVUL|nr:ribonuclease III [Vulcanimicrobium alpinum]BDE08210.1 ribonuclease 3 [Vulcanimicrobium alpinum]